MSNKGNLLLIPSPIAANTSHLALTAQTKHHLPRINHFLVENVRTARRYLSSLKIYNSIESLSFSVLDKDTKEEDLDEMFDPIFAGHDIGVLSESGCPGIADPGALAVRFAHKNAIRVIPLVGPSSLFLALMASGLSGQHFAFHGYLPIESQQISRAIRGYEEESRAKAQTQMFIETPYRNRRLFSHLVKNLRGDTELCVAIDITGEQEHIVTRPVVRWNAAPEWLAKQPAVFLFLAH